MKEIIILESIFKPVSQSCQHKMRNIDFQGVLHVLFNPDKRSIEGMETIGVLSCSCPEEIVIKSFYKSICCNNCLLDMQFWHANFISIKANKTKTLK
ncbi:MAG TPA: hypothetical protein PK651_11185, partial [Smithellaceae bacterium]|nr:hypothetical protein [Smithellaceae bacterium]